MSIRSRLFVLVLLSLTWTTYAVAQCTWDSTTSTGNIIESCGKVGIGTTGAPADPLHINGTSNVNLRLTHSDASSGLNGLLFYEGSTLYGFINQRGSTYSVPEGKQFNIGNNAAGGAMAFVSGGYQRAILDPAGQVGIGTPTPHALLDLSSTTSGGPRLLLSGKDTYTGTTSDYGIAMMLGLNTPGNRQLWIADSGTLADPNAPMFRAYIYPSGVELAALSNAGLGNKPLSLNANNGFGTTVGIGLTYPDPTVKLQLQGSFRLGSNAGNSDILIFTDAPGTLNGTSYAQVNSIMPVTIPASGTTRTALHLKNAVGSGTNQIDLVVDGNVAAKYQDLAEWVPATVDMPAGTVVVLNSAKTNEVMPSFRAYDTAVAGVVSAQPGLLLGEAGPSKVKIATTGRVKVRVNAAAHPIAVGDLLVTSEQSGVAMGSQPVDVGGIKIHRPGTLIGKALEPLKSGEGEILVLLSLQ